MNKIKSTKKIKGELMGLACNVQEMENFDFYDKAKLKKAQELIWSAVNIIENI